MSPRRFDTACSEADATSLRRFWSECGIRIRDARLKRGWAVRALAGEAGVSPTVAYEVELGVPTSVEAVIRLASALGLRMEVELVDPKRKREPAARLSDPVHSAMGEFEAGHLRRFGSKMGLDEPYQHYQFAGRADLVAWDLDTRALLHIENRTRFPDIQEMAGSFNAKRAYLGMSLAQRFGIRGWASETHVIAALWSAEVLHALRLRPATFQAICPDPADAFAAWWSGSYPTSGTTSSLVVIDPLTAGRARPFIPLGVALSDARPRHGGYADVAAKLLVAG